MSETNNDQTPLLLEQYSILITMTENLIQRRNSFNSFYLTICSGFLGVIGLVLPLNDDQSYDMLLSIICISGLIISFSWIIMIRTYKRYLGIRYELIIELEDQLPAQPIRKEWDKLSGTRNISITTIETLLAVLFVLFFVVLLILFIWK